MHLNAVTGGVIPSSRMPTHFNKHSASDVFLLKDANRSLLLIDSDRKVRSISITFTELNVI